MALRKVLIAWELGANLGHAARLVPVAERLQAAGTKVVFVVRKLKEVAALLGPGRGPLLQAPMPSSLPDAPAVNHADLLLKDGFGDTPAMAARVRAWLALFELLQPDALLCDFSPASLYAARVAGIPALPMGHGFEIPPPAESLPSFQPWKPQPEIERLRVEALSEALEQLARLFGAGAPRELQALYPPGQSALCIFPELDHFARPPEQGRFTGPLWAELAPDECVEWPAAPGPKVLCYLRPQEGEFDVLYRNLAARGCSTILVAPGLAAAAQAQARAAGVHVTDKPVCVGRLMAQAAGVVTHAGMGMVGMAAQAAVPMLLMPSNAEQLILARRLSQDGLAVATTEWGNEAALRRKLAQLLEADNAQLRAYRDRHAGYEPQQGAAEVRRLLEELCE